MEGLRGGELAATARRDAIAALRPFAPIDAAGDRFVVAVATRGARSWRVGSMHETWTSGSGGSCRPWTVECEA